MNNSFKEQKLYGIYVKHYKDKMKIYSFKQYLSDLKKATKIYGMEFKIVKK